MQFEVCSFQSADRPHPSSPRPCCRRPRRSSTASPSLPWSSHSVYRGYRSRRNRRSRKTRGILRPQMTAVCTCAPSTAPSPGAWPRGAPPTASPWPCPAGRGRQRGWLLQGRLYSLSSRGGGRGRYRIRNRNKKFPTRRRT